MAWESDLLASCGRLKEAAESLTIGIGRLASAFNLSLPDDITAAQLTAFYRLAHELTRTELPPASLVLHEQIDDLKAGLNSRRELLERRDHASDALTAALSSFAAALGCRAEEECRMRSGALLSLGQRVSEAWTTACRADPSTVRSMNYRNDLLSELNCLSKVARLGKQSRRAASIRHSSSDSNSPTSKRLG